ncbi:hypothetical protein Taro_052370 [Colocasia esculenta]|uniref:Uncharacterized protein n=1 Tax=Colocasia esculenta TaxID=4460 RepID=A0A843XJU7_COLES|nr:hypothetical protein [Colocasia esculenta]
MLNRRANLRGAGHSLAAAAELFRQPLSILTGLSDLSLSTWVSFRAKKTGGRCLGGQIPAEHTWAREGGRGVSQTFPSIKACTIPLPTGEEGELKLLFSIRGCPVLSKVSFMYHPSSPLSIIFLAELTNAQLNL